MKPQLTDSHQRTYDAVFGHPVARNLSWRDVRSMLEELGEVAVQPNGHLKVICNGKTLVLHPDHDRTVTDIDELMAIRHFLKKIGEDTPTAQEHGMHLLVVIDHHEARVYKAQLHGTAAQHIAPFDPHGVGRYLHNVQDESNGQRKPEQKSFYEAVIKTLEGAEKILIFGSGTGASSAMEHLVAELKRHHGDLARRIVGAVTLNQQHLSEDQLLAEARAFYASQSKAAHPATS